MRGTGKTNQTHAKIETIINSRKHKNYSRKSIYSYETSGFTVILLSTLTIERAVVDYWEGKCLCRVKWMRRDQNPCLLEGEGNRLDLNLNNQDIALHNLQVWVEILFN